MVKEIARPDIGDYFKTHKVEAVQDPRRCPAAWTDGAEGQDWFKIVSQEPGRVACFAAAMKFAEELVPVFGMYPFERLVDTTFPDNLPLIVDVGGGRGQVMKAIKDALPTLKGRLICQDRPEVLATVDKDDIGKVEKLPHDFFEPQPIKGRHIYPCLDGASRSYQRRVSRILLPSDYSRLG